MAAMAALGVRSASARVGFANSSWLSAYGDLARLDALLSSSGEGCLLWRLRISLSGTCSRWWLVRPRRSKALEILATSPGASELRLSILVRVISAQVLRSMMSAHRTPDWRSELT
jgi:hypothetical protein